MFLNEIFSALKNIKIFIESVFVSKDRKGAVVSQDVMEMICLISGKNFS